MSVQPLRPLTPQAITLLDFIAEHWERFNCGPLYADMTRRFRRSSGTLHERLSRLFRRGLLVADWSTTPDDGQRLIPGTLRLTRAGRDALQAAAEPADVAGDGQAMEDTAG